MAAVHLKRIDVGYYGGPLRALRYGATGWPMAYVRQEARNNWKAYIVSPTGAESLDEPATTTDQIGHFERLKDARNALITRAALYY